MARRLANAAHQLRESARCAAGSRHGMFAGLHRSLGWRMLSIEGFLRPEQARYFRELLVANPGIRRVLEIGFNAGHSSYVFLNARPDVHVTSFDLGEHGYVSAAKQFIDRDFPGRHELVLGDSTITVPQYRPAGSLDRFDLAFIDGGHEYGVAAADLRNCRQLMAPGGLVVIDDLLHWRNWGSGPARAWSEACGQGLVAPIELLQDGQRVESARKKAYTAVWALGRYSSVG